MNNENIVGPRYSLRVEDLRQEHRLQIQCLACGHHGQITAAELQQRHQGNERLVHLEKRFRCRRCRGGGFVFWRIETDPTDNSL